MSSTWPSVNSISGPWGALSVNGDSYSRATSITPLAVRCSTISSTNRSWFAENDGVGQVAVERLGRGLRGPGRPGSGRRGPGRGTLRGRGRCPSAVPAPDSSSICSRASRSVGGELVVAAQPLQRDVVLVVTQVGAGLGAEPFPVRAGGHPGQLDHGALAELVGEVGVDDCPLGLLDEPDQAADPASGQLQHRQGDVDPPLVAGDLGPAAALGP